MQSNLDYWVDLWLGKYASTSSSLNMERHDAERGYAVVVDRDVQVLDSSPQFVCAGAPSLVPWYIHTMQAAPLASSKASVHHEL